MTFVDYLVQRCTILIGILFLMPSSMSQAIICGYCSLLCHLMLLRRMWICYVCNYPSCSSRLFDQPSPHLPKQAKMP